MPVLFQFSPPYDHVLPTLAWALPLLLSVLVWLPGFSATIVRWAPLAVLPALMLTFSAPVTIYWSGLMMGASFSITTMSAIWLWVSVALWFSAAWYGVYYLAHDAARPRYTFFFLGAMCGNFGTILAADPITFFTFFALMSFMSYGLVIHDGKSESRKAGRVYLAMAVFGEVLQFAALSLLIFPMIGKNMPLTFQSLELSSHPVAIGLIIAGFGIKAGLLGLHVWLPMAHPVAPTPASAVLSGSMIKIGLLGWLTFLPLGAVAMLEAGGIMIVLGLAGALTAALLGVWQSNPKAVLAYSSVSQMGLLAAAVGVAMVEPRIAHVMKWMILVYVAHHAFAKCLLFLSVGLKSVQPMHRWGGGLFWGGSMLAALALAGAPLTSGMIAKSLMKDTILHSQLNHAEGLVMIFSGSAIGTTMLMVRYLWLLRRIRFDEGHQAARGIWFPWILLLAMVVSFTAYLVFMLWQQQFIPQVEMLKWWKNSWPILAGLGMYGGVALMWKKTKRPGLLVPPGDIYHGIEWLWRRIERAAHSFGKHIHTLAIDRHHGWRHRSHQGVTWISEQLVRTELALTIWWVGGAVLAGTMVLLLWLAWI